MYSKLILYVALALSISFLCSLLESIILSVSHAFVMAKIKKHPHAGKILKKHKDHIDRPLSAILTMNTIANTLGAAGVGAEVNHLWGNQAFAIASIILTVAILVFSEVIPKTIGAVYWKRLALPAGYVIQFMVSILGIPVALLEAISRLISRNRSRIYFSREEMMAAAELGEDQGTLHMNETRIIHNILCLRNIRVKDILTPRSVLLAFQKDKTIMEIVKFNSPIRFSRIPVYGKNLDDITGLVHRYKILQAYYEGRGNHSVATLARDIHAIPDTKSVADTLDEFIKRRDHMFLVIDEYGGTAGIITLEDAIETLLGVEIVDEFDTVEDMRKYALTQWQIRQKQRRE